MRSEGKQSTVGLSTATAMKRIHANESTINLNDEELSSLQRVLTMMLTDIGSLCDKYGYQYVLGGGTCLGAVRHRGFIPWDDDIDINVARRDFDALLESVQADYPEKYTIQHPRKTHDAGLGIAKVRLKGTTYKSHSDFTPHSGVFIDVFPIDNVPDNACLRAVHGFGSLALGFIVSCRRFAEHAQSYLKLVKGQPEYEHAFAKKIAIGRAFSFRSLDAWTAAWDRWNALCHDDTTKSVTIPAGVKHYFGRITDRDRLFPVAHCDFESFSAAIPGDYDAYLRCLYGPDYMTPPPEGAREKHVLYEFDLGEYAGETG